MMEVLTGASRVINNRSHFSNVSGNQYNSNYTYYMTDKTPGKNKKGIRGVFELSEFTEVQRGDIYKDKDVCYSWRLCSNGKDDTEAIVYHAKLNIVGPFGTNEFTVKSYHGRNAMKEWRRDLLLCSKDWRGDVPLFGYNKSSVPSLILCGELVPIAQIEPQLGQVATFYSYLLHDSFRCLRDEMWVDFSRGKIIRGPVGPKSFERHGDRFDVRGIPADVEFLNNDVCMRYFQSGVKDDRYFLYALSYCRLDDPPSPPTSYLPEVIARSSKSRIALVPNVIWASVQDSLDDGQLMPDGATRYQLANDGRRIYITSLGRWLDWLSHAWSVFNSQGIGSAEDLSNFKLIELFVKLSGGIQRCKTKCQRRELYAPIYFFVKSSFSPDTPFYFWSLDPMGQSPLSQEMCKYLGLPFKLCFEVCHTQTSWPTKIYKMVRDYQIERGFDPRTTYFGQYLGYSVFEVVPRHHIEEAVEVESVPRKRSRVGTLFSRFIRGIKRLNCT